MNTIKSYVMYKVTSPAKQGTSISHHYLLTTSSTTISIHAERTSISQVGFALIFDAMFIKCLLQFRGHTALAIVSQKANLFSWINTAQQEGIQGLSKSVVCSIYKSSVFMGCNHSPEWRWPKAWVPLSAARAPAAALLSALLGRIWACKMTGEERQREICDQALCDLSQTAEVQLSFQLNNEEIQNLHYENFENVILNSKIHTKRKGINYSFWLK